MPNIFKAKVLNALRAEFGQLRKMKGSESLFELVNGAARIYFRYSKVHERGRTFFGLREADLRQLEGHDSYLCLLAGDSPPILIPYKDFEDVFRSAQTARDGQYKVQLVSQRQALELYIPHLGRFNVDGYVGTQGLARSIDSNAQTSASSYSHSQIQTLLAGIGHSKDFDVYVPENDSSKLDWTLTEEFRLRSEMPSGFAQVAHVLSEIDVMWVRRGGNQIEGLFEVEHSTPIYSSLLRFNDILLTDTKISRFSIVSNDARRALFLRQLSRPTFRKSGLSEVTSFLEYVNVLEWHSRIRKEKAATD
jgi:hypothetical protein